MTKNIDKTSSYVASKYSKKIWTCIPKYRAYIRSGAGANNTLVYPTLVPEVSWYSCAVCKLPVNATSNGVHITTVVEGADCYYVCPPEHNSCRELLRLNPLVYE